MDLVSDRPFWLLKNGLMSSYPALDQDQTCEVLVIGAGITGALIADRLCAAGLETIIIDRRDVGQGSTSASTALLQYEIDTHLTDLISKVGREHAERAYWLCKESISSLEGWISDLIEEVSFDRKQSLYLASRPEDVQPLSEECEARRNCGIEVDFIGPEVLRSDFGLSAPAGLVSVDAAQLDAYRLAHRLLARNLSQGLRVYDRTEVVRFEHQSDGVRLHTNRGASIRAKWMVIACGYEAQDLLTQKVVDLNSTYAFVTPPLKESGWPDRYLLWESSRPYCYMRKTAEGRLLFGGADDPFKNADLRDSLIGKKTETLLARCRELLPEWPIEPDYSWAGTFGETKDGLPYIGATEEFPRAYFALGFGGNGIVFSVLAADMMPDLIKTGEHPDQRIFRFDR